MAHRIAISCQNAYHRLVAALDTILLTDLSTKGLAGLKATLGVLGLIDQLCH